MNQPDIESKIINKTQIITMDGLLIVVSSKQGIQKIKQQRKIKL